MKIIKMIKKIVLAGMLVGVVIPQAYSQQTYTREPFLSQENATEVFNSTLPSESTQELPIVSGSREQLRAAPPGFEGNPLGLPVIDGLLIIVILASIYCVTGKILNEKRNVKNEK